jgi:hypothetical protein
MGSFEFKLPAIFDQNKLQLDEALLLSGELLKLKFMIPLIFVSDSVFLLLSEA